MADPSAGAKVPARQEHRPWLRQPGCTILGCEVTMRYEPVPRVTRCGWWLRGLWPDGNPLRRAVDRVEAGIMAGLLAVFLIGVPVAGLAAAQWSYAAGLRVEHAQESAWHQIPAVLLANAPAQGYDGNEPQVHARWTARDGTQHSGDVPAPAGAAAGRTVLVWADSSGRLTGPPRLHRQVIGQAVLATLLTPPAVGVLLLGIWMIAHRMLQRRRLEAWDADWRMTAPRWTGRR